MKGSPYAGFITWRGRELFEPKCGSSELRPWENQSRRLEEIRPSRVAIALHLNAGPQTKASSLPYDEKFSTRIRPS